MQIIFGISVLYNLHISYKNYLKLSAMEDEDLAHFIVFASRVEFEGVIADHLSLEEDCFYYTIFLSF